MDIHWIEVCTSTNQVAKQLADDGWSGVLVAEYQTQGRGRMERAWLSNSGENLLLSWAFECRCKVQELPRIPLLLAGELAHAFGLFVKWPNDLVSRSGKKIAGCLVELVDDKPTLIFGLGVNVCDQSPIMDTASSLILEKKEYTRMEVLEMICDVVYNTSDFSLECWRKRALYMGQRIRVRDIEGVMTGIRDDGALLIDEHVIFTGDVELVEDKR